MNNLRKEDLIAGGKIRFHYDRNDTYFSVKDIHKQYPEKFIVRTVNKVKFDNVEMTLLTNLEHKE